MPPTKNHRSSSMSWPIIQSPAAVDRTICPADPRPFSIHTMHMIMDMQQPIQAANIRPGRHAQSGTTQARKHISTIARQVCWAISMISILETEAQRRGMAARSISGAKESACDMSPRIRPMAERRGFGSVPHAPSMRDGMKVTARGVCPWIEVFMPLMSLDEYPLRGETAGESMGESHGIVAADNRVEKRVNWPAKASQTWEVRGTLERRKPRIPTCRCDDEAFILWFPGHCFPCSWHSSQTRLCFLAFLGRHLAWGFWLGDYHRPINRTTDWPCLTYSRL